MAIASAEAICSTRALKNCTRRDINRTSDDNSNQYTANRDMTTSGIFKELRLTEKPKKESSLTLSDRPIRRTSRHDKEGYTGDRIRINVSGLHYETRISTLERFPNTLLGNSKQRKIYYDDTNSELFLDRDRQCFEYILRFYQTGGFLVKPAMIPEDVFFKELRFYQLDKFVQNHSKKLSKKRKPASVPSGKTRVMLWRLMEEPSSSIYSKILSVISVSIIFISIWNFCLETLPSSKELLESLCTNVTVQVPHEAPVVVNGTMQEFYYDTKCTYDIWKYPFFIIESFCVGYFTLEVIVRFIISPNRIEFCKSALNIIDVISIIPYYVQIIIDLGKDGVIGGHMGPSEDSFSSLIILRALRLVRIMRIFKLSRYFTKLRVLGKTLMASAGELAILVFFIFIAMIIFSTVVYFCEASSGEENKFDSIPASFWWSVVTMTTVGYGDVVPRTVLGKIVGFVCAITGVLCIALPVPSIVNNFVKQLEITEKEKQAILQKQQVSIVVSEHTEENGERILKAMSTIKRHQGEYNGGENIALNISS